MKGDAGSKMEIIQYVGKNVAIYADNGKEFYGEVIDYIYPEDNYPEGESILLELQEPRGMIIEFRPEEIIRIAII